MHLNLPSEPVVAATAVLMLHLALVALLIRADRRARAERPEEERTGILYLLSQPQQVTESPELARKRARHRPKTTRAPVGPRLPATVLRPPEAPGAIAVPNGPEVDWNREAEEVARSVAGARGTAVHPESGGHPASPYHECKRQPQFAWDPQPKRFGIESGLPYVRVGKRCFISLLLFGCALGRLPEANGDLFDPVRDGPTSVSSVPDIDDCT